MTAPLRLVVPVLGSGPVADRAVAELGRDLPEVHTLRVDDPTSLAAEVTGTAEPSEATPPVVPLVLAVAGDVPGSAATRVDALTRDATLADATVLLLTDHPRHDELSGAVDEGRLAGLVAATWRDGLLASHARSHVARWLWRRDVDRPAAWRDAAERVGPEWSPASVLLQDLELDDHTLARRLTEALDDALGPRPRLDLRPGTRLTRQDVEVNGVFVVLAGAVALDRTTEVGELRLHHRSTGPVVGLLSLAQQRRAFFTARATTDVEVVHLTIEQLDVAVSESPAVAAALAAGAVRALAARLRRSEQLQVEKRRLNADLEDERARLAEAYAALEAARLELVTQARFATLGELAAGVGHELNNPVAALARAASFVAEDVTALLADQPEGHVLAEVLDAARTRSPLRPADERAARRRLAESLGDEALARRLTAAGITDPAAVRDVLDGTPASVERIERAAGLGAAVRNLEVASGRIAELVESLRSYARPDGPQMVEVDVNAGLDDTLRLLAHRLVDVEVVRDYGELPPIEGQPGQLGQVWTNLLVNAVEALHGPGRIQVRTDQPTPTRIRVRITDSGPGIAPAERERIFEPRFTTKDGAVRYGLGLGLPIARRIVEAHGGSIALETAPEGGTLATVELPLAGAEEAER